MVDIKRLDTEQRNPNTSNIDKLNTLQIVQLINSEDKKVADSIEAVLPAIASAIDAIYERLRDGGRLIYVGAGTSGRLGLLDAAECPPTFSVDYDMVIALLAGGPEAFIKAKEGAEDSLELGAEDLKAINFSAKDALVGIAASGRTPYVMGAMQYARSAGGFTIGLSCTSDSEISQVADVDISPQPGPEVITGSTRMKSGTAQKMVLNMLTTVAMIKLGKTYGNLMVDLKATNEKLISRAVNIVCMATGVSEERAKEELIKCEFSAKNAILMILANVDFATSTEALCKFDGRIYLALDYLKQI
ncbi:MAG: N-acetylmuramic acid 6-phosphate etherase [Defluviitaleaceae bacterium]|nr:N-acetylmuramic acid 6-phosphate etherase [Defluviitaleaceae bacterium]